MSPIRSHAVQFVVCMVLLVVGPMASAYEKPDTVRIAQAQGHLTHKIAATVVQEAYRRLGITAEFEHLPSKRSMTLANIGRLDGEVGRVEQALEDFPNLLFARGTPITRVRGVVITKDTECACRDWNDLQPFRIGIRRGEVYAEKGTSGMSVHPTNNYHQLFSMLLNDRIDLAVGIESSVVLELETAFSESGLRVAGGTLVDIPLYHMMHKRHTALVPEMNRVLSEMQADGTIERLHSETIERIIKERREGEKF